MMIRQMAMLMGCMVLAGCAMQPTVLPATAHQPTTAGQVKIYQEQPERYEQLARLEIYLTDEMQWNNRGESPEGFEHMKAKAAALGANGLLLQAAHGDFDYRVTVGDGNGDYYQVPMKNSPSCVVVYAIYVHKP